VVQIVNDSDMNIVASAVAAASVKDTGSTPNVIAATNEGNVQIVPNYEHIVAAIHANAGETVVPDMNDNQKEQVVAAAAISATSDKESKIVEEDNPNTVILMEHVAAAIHANAGEQVVPPENDDVNMVETQIVPNPVVNMEDVAATIHSNTQPITPADFEKLNKQEKLEVLQEYKKKGYFSANNYIDNNAKYVNGEYSKWYNENNKGTAGGTRRKRPPSLKKYRKRNRNKTIRLK
jgi:hypothetical protein